MDFDRELRNFVRSGLPLRQTREDAHWTIHLNIGSLQLCADACDLSLGGLGASLPSTSLAGHSHTLNVGQQVVLTIKWPEKETPVSDISAKVVWIKSDSSEIKVGFVFEALSEVQAGFIERYMFSKIIQRNLDET